MSTKFKLIFSGIALLIIGYIVAVGFIAKKHDDRDVDLEQTIKALQKERDSIQSLFNASRNREQLYILKAEQDSLRRVTTEKKIAILESKNKTYSERLKEIEKITISRPDSFLIKRYPN